MRAEQDAAFDAAFDRLRRIAYRAAYRLLGNPADGEEIAAETLERAYLRWVRIEGHAEPWCVTVATNLALDRARRSQRARSHQGGVVGEQQTQDPHVELRLDLQAVLRRLPRRQREVVALRFLADFSERDIAAALGLSAGTVKSYTARARRSTGSWSRSRAR